jgi:hypothetical protein
VQLRIFTDPDGATWLAADDVIDLLHNRADAWDPQAALRRDADAIFDLTDIDQPAQPRETAA